MLMIPERDTSFDEVLKIDTPYGRLQHAIKEGTVIERKYFSVAYLQDVNPGHEIRDQRSDCPQLAVTEEDGIIVSTLATLRGEVGRHMGMEVSIDQAQALERNDDRLIIPRFRVYDVRVVDAVQTDGPAERSELLASFENEMKKRKDEKTTQMVMAESLAKLVDFLGNNKTDDGGILTPDQLMAQMSEQMTPDQLRELANLMDDDKKPSKGKK